VTNRITNHLPQPEPEPEKNDGGESDLTKGELPKLPKEGTDDMAKTSSPDADAAKAAEATSGLEAELRETLEAISGRRIAAEAVGIRHRIPQDEMEVLVRAAKAIRAAVDQSTAPPVDAELLRKATWGQLPPALAEMVVDLCIRFESWNLASIAEDDRRAAIEKAADTN
jgi:hypothetical protein